VQALAPFLSRNLFDRRFYLGGYALGIDVGINTFIPGAPRQFGVEPKYTF
jgi:hypothetical protein